MPYQELDLVWSRVRGGEAAYLHNKQFLEFVIATQFTGRKGVASMRIMKVRGDTCASFQLFLIHFFVP